MKDYQLMVMIRTSELKRIAHCDFYKTKVAVVGNPVRTVNG